MELDNFKIYWAHLLDEISSNPRSFQCIPSTSAATTSKHTQVNLRISVLANLVKNMYFRQNWKFPIYLCVFACGGGGGVWYTLKTPRIWRDLEELFQKKSKVFVNILINFKSFSQTWIRKFSNEGIWNFWNTKSTKNSLQFEILDQIRT